MRHQLDDPVHVTRFEPADHPLVVLLRLLGVDQAGEGIGRGGIPEIGEEAEQPVTADPAEGDEMKLPIKVEVFAPLHGPATLRIWPHSLRISSISSPVSRGMAIMNASRSSISRQW